MTRTVLMVRLNGQTMTDEVPVELELGDTMEEVEIDSKKIGVIVRHFQRTTPSDSDPVIYEETDWDVKIMDTAAFVQRIQQLPRD